MNGCTNLGVGGNAIKKWGEIFAPLKYVSTIQVVGVLLSPIF